MLLLEIDLREITVRKSRKGVSPVVTDVNASHCAMKALRKPASRPFGRPLSAF